MNVTIIDNKDYMLTIWAENRDPLDACEQAGMFASVHKLAETLWLVRVTFANAQGVLNFFTGVKYKMALVRYTSESTYYSSESTDQYDGRKVTG